MSIGYRKSPSRIWNHFHSYKNAERLAVCNICENKVSYRSTTSNLQSHLKRKHAHIYDLYFIQNRKYPASDNEDEESNSSIKFSSEIWGHFDQEESLARCTLCQKTTENTVEDMRNHLEEDHPAVLIEILNKKPSDKNDNSDEEMVAENNVEEEAFTEIVYLEEEVKKKTRNPLKRTKPRPTIEQEKPRIEYKFVSQPETRPEIDSFLNYIGVLLKNVPKDSFPKLQLDVISLILNAQMPQPVTVPTTAVIAVPTQIHMNETGDYHITIQNKNDKDT